MVVNAKHLTM
uniref:Uncharacterized protein n=1 Tax=Rhizophora mucronata TaxID=61149 RepID=A0A2P2NWL9_RHIMU